MGDDAHPAYKLLARAHSPTTASRLFLEKVVQKPLLLRPSSPPASAKNARTRRQKARQEQRALRRKSNKPRPLSAKQKRALCVHEIPKNEQRYELYAPMHAMWQAYMREILGFEDGRTPHIQAVNAGPTLTSAEYIGAELEVVRSRCVSRVGLKGIVVKDSKFVFELITRKNEIKNVPKEHTIFRFELPVKTREQSEASESPGNLVFELHGEQFKHRSTDRANKKFKQHSMPYL